LPSLKLNFFEIYAGSTENQQIPPRSIRNELDISFIFLEQMHSWNNKANKPGYLMKINFYVIDNFMTFLESLENYPGMQNLDGKLF
jgi:hypothetical protein